MTEPVYILGGYQTDFALAWSRQGKDISDMVRESTQGALENARLDASAIQSVYRRCGMRVPVPHPRWRC
jgi:acetyl-CoA C-acetyltransferase